MPDTERKECTFRVRMTEEERAAITAAAESNDQKASEWARDLLLKAAKTKATKPKSARRKAGESNPVSLGPTSSDGV